MKLEVRQRLSVLVRRTTWKLTNGNGSNQLSCFHPFGTVHVESTSYLLLSMVVFSNSPHD